MITIELMIVLQFYSTLLTILYINKSIQCLPLRTGQLNDFNKEHSLVLGNNTSILLICPFYRKEYSWIFYRRPCHHERSNLVPMIDRDATRRMGQVLRYN